MQHWDRIEAFVIVVREGSFSRAASELGVSVSHVSRSISRLEQSLDVPLLYRTTRTLSLTDAGRIYFEHCHALFDGFKSATQAVQSLGSAPQGTLRVSAATTYGERFIAPLINEFKHAHPQLTVELHLSNRRVHLIEENFDIAIRLGALEDSSLVARQLARRNEFVVAHPGYIARYGYPTTPGDLRHHNCLIGSTRKWVFFEQGKRRDVTIDGDYRVNSGAALLDAVLEGFGIAQLPDYYVAPYLKTGELRAVLDEFRHPHTGVWAVFQGRQPLSPKVRLFLDHALERLPELSGDITDYET
ncbi:LysR family transcriptional regulator [Larsenimonas suaedae]|uniref:LysR family transcriptional regulator n=1 Tax=Larsenimonas suaedae TaxID=1851019 RepID=A0ABU1GTL4_9GAMM|nr:LysR family transcriptional regulator [Larsenimonas suaedae]MCM2971817.1 LysR family transcriptional regulator [Larsenimonas suaedae]MDR5895369.1 LysR family transcriptional regulator [Larsenimonas suaedae]